MCVAILALVLLAAPACKKDFLEVPPQGFVTDDNFYSTAENALLGVNGIYSVLRLNTFNDGLFPMFDIMSDDAIKGSNATDALPNIGLPYDQFQLNASTGNTQSWYYTLYVGVRRSNAVIERVPPIKMDETLKKRIISEARFLRALFYLDLARGYGNVPFVTSLTLPTLDNLRQATAKQVYDEIVKPDLLYAKENLPATFTGENLGRATKGAANGLLARAALFFKEYDVARTAAEEVINSGLYSLEPDYERAFSVAGQYGPESVFEIGSIGQEDNFGQDQGGNQFGNVQGVRGSPNRGWGFNRPSMDLLRAFQPGDSRKEKGTIHVGEIIDGIEIKGDGDTPDVRVVNGDTVEIELYNQKVWTPGRNVPTQWGHHRRFIRYADILLMAAEANAQGGDPAKAAQYVNQVRARARNGAQGVLPDIAANDQLLQNIYQERRFELFLEGHRFFDLVRTDRTDLMVPLGFVKGKHELQPIPQPEIDVTNGKLKQNFGYN